MPAYLTQAYSSTQQMHTYTASSFTHCFQIMWKCLLTLCCFSFKFYIFHCFMGILMVIELRIEMKQICRSALHWMSATCFNPFSDSPTCTLCEWKNISIKYLCKYRVCVKKFLHKQAKPLTFNITNIQPYCTLRTLISFR